MSTNHSITFLPSGKTVSVSEGTTILQACIDNELHLEHACGGFCACTTCHVIIREGEDTTSKIIMMNDGSRAFFEAPAVRQVCVEIPEEDMTAADRRAENVGHLRMSLYGTRGAAMNWQEEVAREMTRWGFGRGRYKPCLYYSPTTGLICMVHGDDFVSVGSAQAAEQFKDQL